MKSDLDDAEERCLEAEAWADEIAAWGRARRGEADAAEAEALSRMVTAIVKSVRLSMVAGEDEATRSVLLEELDELLAKYRSPPSGDDDDLSDLPASKKSTIPPPPGLSPEDIWRRAPKSGGGRFD